MSKLAEFRKFEKKLSERLVAFEALKGDSALQREIEFEQKLRELMAKYGCSLRTIVALIDPNGLSLHNRVSMNLSQKRIRRARVTKQYHNPHTGEVVQTKGGNHTQLKKWKAEYRALIVETWRKA
ncbi:histone-like nucleoid-structuring protein, MvaT/MvaU family [Pseudomonas syringae]|uniref:histone-like nucleoid-structuring protein, MvaT/MvaU family n=1 Tax=Pseudomonas syringae TaxID=317 RepID=UPI003F754CE3